jgi:hypothetical protein
MSEGAEIPTVEAGWIIREEEDFIGGKRAAALPDRHWPFKPVCQSCPCYDMTVDEYVDAEAANVIARGCDDGFDEAYRSRKITPAGCERGDVRRQAS